MLIYQSKDNRCNTYHTLLLRYYGVYLLMYIKYYKVEYIPSLASSISLVLPILVNGTSNSPSVARHDYQRIG